MDKTQWALQKITDVRAEFRANNPPPYLDLSTNGQINRVLSEAIAELQFMIETEVSR